MNTVNLILLMFLCGLLGGTVNFALMEDEGNWKEYLKKVTVGIGASFLVPLFLATVSSKLIREIIDSSNEEPEKIFVFSGFCLLSAIFSRKFIEKLGEEALNVAKKARSEAEDASNTVTGVAQSLIEKDEEESEGEVEIQDFPLNDEEKLVLRSLPTGLPNFRSSKGIGMSYRGILKETEVLPFALEACLSGLVDKGLVSRMKVKNEDFWSLTSKGRRFVSVIIADETKRNVSNE